jgi:hypothetical protein
MADLLAYGVEQHGRKVWLRKATAVERVSSGSTILEMALLSDALLCASVADHQQRNPH